MAKRGCPRSDAPHFLRKEDGLPEAIRRYLPTGKKLTSSVGIDDVLEIIRGEARASTPKLQEACMLVIDPEAEDYTRPLCCAMERQRINCQPCKSGRSSVAETRYE